MKMRLASKTTKDSFLKLKRGEATQRGQANKSVGRMPRHQEPKKDATSCEKLWGAANEHRSIDIRMRKRVTAIL